MDNDDDAAGFDVVTGAFSYTGRAIAARLLDAGREVRTLTWHPERAGMFGGRVRALQYRFDDPDALALDLRGARTLYNTYWVRFPQRGTTFELAVRDSTTLFEAAARAGVRKIVHISVTNPSSNSAIAYFRAKAAVEATVAELPVAAAIVRPSVVYGHDDILINNVAWLLRRFPVFAIAGDGRYRLRPVHVDDVARICVEAAGWLDSGDTGGRLVVDAVGPEILTFETFVRLIRAAVGSHALLVHLPRRLVVVLSRLLGLVTRDVMLTRDELFGLMAELVTTNGPATGTVRFSEWVAARGAEIGRSYASEAARHFTKRGALPSARPRRAPAGEDRACA